MTISETFEQLFIRISFMPLPQQLLLGVSFLIICFIGGYWIGQGIKKWRGIKIVEPKEQEEPITKEAEK